MFRSMSTPYVLNKKLVSCGKKSSVGDDVGETDGTSVGDADGVELGTSDGLNVGDDDGKFDGMAVMVGDVVGLRLTVGEAVSMTPSTPPSRRKKYSTTPTAAPITTSTVDMIQTNVRFMPQQKPLVDLEEVAAAADAAAATAVPPPLAFLEEDFPLGSSVSLSTSTSTSTSDGGPAPAMDEGDFVLLRPDIFTTAFPSDEMDAVVVVVVFVAVVGSVVGDFFFLFIIMNLLIRLLVVAVDCSFGGVAAVVFELLTSGEFDFFIVVEDELAAPAPAPAPGTALVFAAGDDTDAVDAAEDGDDDLLGGSILISVVVLIMVFLLVVFVSR